MKTFILRSVSRLPSDLFCPRHGLVICRQKVEGRRHDKPSCCPFCFRPSAFHSKSISRKYNRQRGRLRLLLLLRPFSGTWPEFPINSPLGRMQYAPTQSPPVYRHGCCAIMALSGVGAYCIRPESGNHCVLYSGQPQGSPLQSTTLSMFNFRKPANGHFGMNMYNTTAKR